MVVPVRSAEMAERGAAHRESSTLERLGLLGDRLGVLDQLGDPERPLSAACSVFTA